MFFIFSSTTVCPSSPIILNSNSLFESDSYAVNDDCNIKHKL